MADHRRRVTFDPQIDAEILSEMRATANGGSLDKALLFLVRHWRKNSLDFQNAQKVGVVGPITDHTGPITPVNDDNETDQLSESLAKIDDLFA
jgi:hypothetical protein